ncbi:MAG: hypothetical protein K0S65_3964 [Labilithrix sp.]|nr:hypothetical protein [Labilithrix sp.]
MRGLGSWLLVVIVAWLLSVRPAHASPAARLVYLRGAGAEHCPDANALRKAVAARLGFDPFFAYANQTIVAEISAAKKGFRGRVQVLDEAGLVWGERVVQSESDDCAETMRAMALGISIAVDALDLDARGTPPPEPVPSPSTPAPPPPSPPPSTNAEPSPAPPPAPRPPPASPAASSRRFAYDARVSALGSMGTAPTLAFGAMFAAGVRLQAFGVALEGRFHPKVTSGVDGGAVWSSLVLGTAAVCMHAKVAFACALGSVGSFRGGGADIPSPQSGSALFGAVGPRVGVHVPLAQPFYVHGHLDVAYLLTPAHIEIDGRTVFALPSLSGTLGIGAGALF